MKKLVGIIVGSDSDLPIVKNAAEVLDELGIGYELKILSAHRTPEQTFEYASTAEERGLEVIIAGAGGAAHLPGVIASLTTLPVIGIPIETPALGGMDSLYSIVQMPIGIPVATVAINGAENAALLAAEILGVKHPEVKEKVKRYRENLRRRIEEKTKMLAELGYKKYLSKMGGSKRKKR